MLDLYFISFLFNPPFLPYYPTVCDGTATEGMRSWLATKKTLDGSRIFQGYDDRKSLHVPLGE